MKKLIDGSTDRVAIYSYKVCTPKEYESLTMEEIKEKVEEFLDSFKDRDLKVIYKELSSILTK